MSAPAALLEHLGVLYDDPESLVASTGPRIADAVADGDDVYLVVDRRTARGFRDWLGPTADRVEFPSPTAWSGDVVSDLRAMVRPGRRTTLLGQYTAADVVADRHLGVEDGINIVLADLPMTILCTCAHDVDPTLVGVLHAGHPELLVDGVASANPDYRAPAAESPVPAALWGPPTLRLDVRAPADLRRLREHVARAAEAVGLRGEAVQDAVQATHEAAVVAAGGPDPAALGCADLAVDPETLDDEPLLPCVLEVRADGGALHCEILGPRPAGDGRVRGGTAGDDPLRVVRLFCDRVLLHDDDETRTVRVLRMS